MVIFKEVSQEWLILHKLFLVDAHSDKNALGDSIPFLTTRLKLYIWYLLMGNA